MQGVDKGQERVLEVNKVGSNIMPSEGACRKGVGLKVVGWWLAKGTRSISQHTATSHCATRSVKRWQCHTLLACPEWQA